MGGRPRVKIKKALEEYEKMEMSIDEITKTYGICRSTLYSYIKKDKKPI